MGFFKRLNFELKRIALKHEKACGCIIIDDKKVLLIYQKNGFWGFPKGHVEENETEYETALREVKEETNLEVEIINQKRYKMEYITHNNIFKEVILFIAKPITTDLKVQEEEVEEARWVSFDEVFDILDYSNSKELFKEVLKDLKENILN